MIRISGDINFTDGFFDTGFGVGSSVSQVDDPRPVQEGEVPEQYRFEYLNWKLASISENEIYYKEAKSRYKNYRRRNISVLMGNINKFTFSDLKTIFKDSLKRFIKR